MGERYARCNACAGSECFTCGGTGFSGDALDYLESQNREERERSKPAAAPWSLRDNSNRLQKMEEDFYRSPKSTPALEAAVLAVQNNMNRDKTLDTMGDIIPFDSSSRGKKSMSSQVSSLTVPATSQGSSVAVVQQQSFFPSESDWKTMLSMGDSAVKSGMLPRAINTKEAAAIIFLKGRELGLPYMVAVAHIHVINGKPSMSAEMIQTLARKNLPGLVINILKSDETSAEIEMIRPEKGSKPFISKFSLENAKQAQLMGKDVWKQYPAAMLFSRAISAGLRKVCPEALMGISYTPEELGASVDQEGNVIETTGRNVTNEIPALAEQLKPNAAQLKRLFAIANAHKVSTQELKEMLSKDYGIESTKDLTIDQYNQLCDKIQNRTTIEVSAAAPVGVVIKTPESPPEAFESLEPGSDLEESVTAQPEAASEVPWAKYRENQTR